MPLIKISSTSLALAHSEDLAAAQPPSVTVLEVLLEKDMTILCTGGVRCLQWRHESILHSTSARQKHKTLFIKVNTAFQLHSLSLQLLTAVAL